MYQRFYLLYIPGRTPVVKASSHPGMTAWACMDGGEAAWVGDRPFPHWLAVDLARQAEDFLKEAAPGDRRRRLRAVIRARLRRWGRRPDFLWERLRPLAPESPIDHQRILEILRGRILTAADIYRAVGEGEYTGLHRTLSELAALELIRAEPAIEVVHFGRTKCRRCGETEIEREDCWHCGDPGCWICPSCASLGPVRGCQTLFSLDDNHRRQALNTNGPALSFALTSAQQKAAAALRGFIANGIGQEFLLWAVCGAGKTEVVLSSIPAALCRGERILVATPRRDVAADLSRKIIAAFPDLPTAVHYGGRHARDGADPAVTVATTHQCLRFSAAFDLVVLDEVDAFPYHNSRQLYYAVRRARKPDGRIVYLTATPPGPLLTRLTRGDLPFVRLPVRPHGRPLPVPEIITMPLRGGIDDRWRPSPGLQRFLSATGDRPILIFVPTVAAALHVGEGLREWGRSGGMDISYVHAADPARDEKRQAFAAGKLKALITTTLLERGLSLGAIDVCVLFADSDRVFDEACLIQIAGRAGRSFEDPDGRVWFVSESVTKAMRAARDAVLAANREAAAGGYLN